ncbi:MAG: hypothetical protein BIFFINMI_04012 [Phycisphaerae bacterium]|nr:hypothetical protein [Phycisphaerae bacterium]
MDKANLYIIVAGVLLFALAFSVIGAIPWILDHQVRTHTVTLATGPKAGQTWTVPDPYHIEGTRQLTVLGEAKDYYQVQICYQCHSQFVRPLAHEVDLYGPPSQAGESSWDTPMLFGTKRTGPDLAREGGAHTDDWHLAHFFDPESVVPESVMQPYDRHFGFAKGGGPMPDFTDEDRQIADAYLNPPPLDRKASAAQRQQAQVDARRAADDFGALLKAFMGPGDDADNPQGLAAADNTDPQEQPWQWRDRWVRAALFLFDQDGNNRLDDKEKSLFVNAGLPAQWGQLIQYLDYDGDKIVTLSDARPTPDADIEKLVHYLQYLGTTIGDWREQAYTGHPIRPAADPVVRLQREIIDLDRTIRSADLARRLDELKSRYAGLIELTEAQWADAAAVKSALTACRYDLIATQLVPLWKSDRGQRVYDNKCVGCHGEQGDGSGPSAMFLGRGLNPYRYTRYGDYEQQLDQRWARSAFEYGLDEKNDRPAKLEPVDEETFNNELEPRLFGDYLEMPRDFTQGFYKFESRPKSGVKDQVPTDEDLFATISRGVNGSAMPAWNRLPEQDRWAVVDYVKAFSLKPVEGAYSGPGPDDEWNTGDDVPAVDSPFLQSARQTPQIDIPEPPGDVDGDSQVWRGRFIFMSVGCRQCHGADGQAEDYIDREAWTGRSIQARNFAKAPLLKGGSEPQDIFRTLRTGINGTPMPAYSADKFLFAGGPQAAAEDYKDKSAEVVDGQRVFADDELVPMRDWLAAQPTADQLKAMTDAQRDAVARERTYALVAYVRWLMRTHGDVKFPQGVPPKR